MVLTKKFSEFTSGGDLANNEVTVGLFGGTNARFNNPWTFLAPGTTGDRPAPSADIYYRMRLNTSLQQYEYYDPIALVWTQFTTTTQFDYSEVTTSPFQMLPQNGYVANSNAIIAFQLPLVSDVGDRIGIAGFGSGGWIIQQQAGQSIIVGNMVSTTGISGSVASTLPSDAIALVCAVANLTWTLVSGPQGNLDIL